MRGGNPIDFLRYEARRRPEIADLIDRIDEISRSDIESHVFPLAWYKKAILDLKNEREKAQRDAGLLRHILDNTHEGFSADPVGHLVIWDSGTCFVRVDGGGQVDIIDGSYLFMPVTGGVWNGGRFSAYVDPVIAQKGRMMQRMVLSRYKEINQEYLNKQFGVFEEKPCFKIYR